MKTIIIYCILLTVMLAMSVGGQFTDTDYSCTRNCINSRTRCRNQCRVNARTGKTRCKNGHLPRRCKVCCEGDVDPTPTGGQEIDEAIADLLQQTRPLSMSEADAFKEDGREALMSLASSSSNSFTLCKDTMDDMVDKTANVLGFYEGGGDCMRGKILGIFLYDIAFLDHCVCSDPPVFNPGSLSLQVWDIHCKCFDA